MKKKLLYSFLLSLWAIPGAWAADYGLPSTIQDGNILHCFNWPAKDVKAALPQIAAAGFGSVQLSPLQRPDARVGENWSSLYRPYDLAFKSSSFCSEQDLKDLCAAAKEYGIKVIVDVVANHVDKTAGYHDTWWDSNGRVRWEGGINYGNRYSVTHGQLGDYGDVNSENSEVIAKGKAYVEKLKSMGVSGIRWDAAKHIGLPSEGCQFWAQVTSVQGMWHYGEILDSPADGQDGLIKEYVKYMSVTDNKYSNGAAKDNGGIYYGHGGAWAVNQGVDASKLVYWGESHDTYSNDEWSQDRDQATIDRAYACVACRNGSTALYLSRPNAKGFNNIKVGKGSTAFTSKHISEVNKFRNLMVGKADWCEAAGNTFTVTRKDGGAVIVTKGSGNVSVVNGGGYCPAGTYTDHVSGGTFTVTASTISGNVGASGIAVLYADGIAPNPTPNPDPNPNPNPNPDPTPSGSYYILGNIDGHQWTTTGGATMTASGSNYVANNVKLTAATGETTCYFNITDALGADWDELNQVANRYGAATEGATITLGTPATVKKYANGVDASGCLSWAIPAGTYDFTFNPTALTLTVVNAGTNPDPNPQPQPQPQPTPEVLTITGDYNLCYNGNLNNVHYWGATESTWPGVTMDVVTGSDGNTYKVAKVPEGTTGCLFNSNGDADKTGDLTYTGEYVMDDNGATSTKVQFSNGVNPNPNPNPEPTPGPTPSGSYYILGNIDGHQWTTTGGATMTASGSNYVANNVKLTAATGETTCYFNITDALGADWDELNQVANRYGAATEGATITLGTPATVKKYANGVDASGCLSWAIPAGTYDFTFDPTALTLTVKNAGDDPIPTPTKPVVTANPAGGTSFTTDYINVTLTVSPEATIYYTIDGSTPTTSSTKYESPIAVVQTTTIKTLAVTADGAQNAQSFSYTKRNNDDPVPVPSGNNLITDYYKVNPNGQVGTKRTVNMSFNGLKSTTALSNWSDADLIAQGVARDVCQAFKGLHERPIIDSYAIYASYDEENLYLGVQMVYSVWDAGGEGKQPGESKPHNMDGRMVWAFDLDPNASFDGYINGTKAIWNDENKPGIKFNNGVDAMWIGSTKPTVGTPGFFVPTPDGHASYDAPYCKPSTVKYGYEDGLLPSISQIWAQPLVWGADTEPLTGNSNWVDMREDVDDSAHTFYEFTFPLSLLGVTKNYIENNGIGVQYIDVYGCSGIGGVPYDPAFFDNAKEEYSFGDNTSKEKEDEDILTYAPARIGKMASSPVESLPVENPADLDVAPVYYNLQGVQVANPSKGIYIVVRGNKVTKEVIR